MQKKKQTWRDAIQLYRRDLKEAREKSDKRSFYEFHSMVEFARAVAREEKKLEIEQEYEERGTA